RISSTPIETGSGTPATARRDDEVERRAQGRASGVRYPAELRAPEGMADSSGPVAARPVSRLRVAGGTLFGLVTELGAGVGSPSHQVLTARFALAVVRFGRAGVHRRERTIGIEPVGWD